MAVSALRHHHDECVVACLHGLLLFYNYTTVLLLLYHAVLHAAVYGLGFKPDILVPATASGPPTC